MRNIFILFISLLCASCSVGEDYISQDFITPSQIKNVLNTQSPSKEITQAWYEIFRDNDLNQLVNLSMNNNLSVQQGIERLQQSRYNLKIQSVQNFPMLNATGEYDYSKASDNQNYSYDINAFKFGFDASWELDIWGKGKYITEQYYSLMKNVQYSLLNIRVSITAEVISNYINLRKTQEMLNIANQNLKLQQDILQTVRDKYNAGVADDLALNQAEYAVETTKSSIPPLKFQIENYKNSISVLLGVLPNQLPINLDKYKKNITKTAFKFDTKKLYELPLDIIRTRPDIMAAEATLQAQNAFLNQAITNLYPTLNLSATFGFISTSGHKLFNNDSQVYGYNPGLSIPIWHWGQLTNNVELQKHVKNEYLINYNEAILTALADIKNSITAVEQAYKTNQYSKTSLNKMRSIMELTRNKYENGLIDFTDVVTAEQNLLTAQNAYAESNAEILQYINTFYKATGGGYNLK